MGQNEDLILTHFDNIFGTSNRMDGAPFKSKTCSIDLNHPCGLIWDIMIDEHMLV